MSDSSTLRIKEMIDTIYERTRTSDISWRKGFDDDVVEANIGRYVVQLVQSTDPDGDPFHYVVLRDPAGTELDTIFGAVLKNEISPSKTSYWDFFGELFRMAHRQASGADKAVMDILDELKGR